jgi:hypothetical protein
MVDDWWIAKNLEGSGRGLFEVLSRNFPVGSEENHVKSVSSACFPAKIRTGHFQNKSP